MTKILPKKFDFKEIKFPVNVRHIHKIGKKNSIGISIFGYENKEKHSIYVLKNVLKKNMLIYYSSEKKKKDIMFSSKTLIL